MHRYDPASHMGPPTGPAANQSSAIGNAGPSQVPVPHRRVPRPDDITIDQPMERVPIDVRACELCRVLRTKCHMVVRGAFELEPCHQCQHFTVPCHILSPIADPADQAKERQIFQDIEWVLRMHYEHESTPVWKPYQCKECKERNFYCSIANNRRHEGNKCTTCRLLSKNCIDAIGGGSVAQPVTPPGPRSYASSSTATSPRAAIVQPVYTAPIGYGRLPVGTRASESTSSSPPGGLSLSPMSANAAPFVPRGAAAPGPAATSASAAKSPPLAAAVPRTSPGLARAVPVRGAAIGISSPLARHPPLARADTPAPAPTTTTSAPFPSIAATAGPLPSGPAPGIGQSASGISTMPWDVGFRPSNPLPHPYAGRPLSPPITGPHPNPWQICQYSGFPGVVGMVWDTVTGTSRLMTKEDLPPASEGPTAVEAPWIPTNVEFLNQMRPPMPHFSQEYMLEMIRQNKEKVARERKEQRKRDYEEADGGI